jgi:hypothetical protein
MSRLYLHCGLCGRKQADGLLSRGFWGHLEVGTGNTLCACPTCKQSVDWEARLLATIESRSPELERTVWGFQAS